MVSLEKFAFCSQSVLSSASHFSPFNCLSVVVVVVVAAAAAAAVVVLV